MTNTAEPEHSPYGHNVADQFGVARFDVAERGIRVRPAIRGVYVRVYDGPRELTFSLSPDDARHLAGLLEKDCTVVTKP